MQSLIWRSVCGVRNRKRSSDDYNEGYLSTRSTSEKHCGRLMHHIRPNRCVFNTKTTLHRMNTIQYLCLTNQDLISKTLSVLLFHTKYDAFRSFLAFEDHGCGLESAEITTDTWFCLNLFDPFSAYVQMHDTITDPEWPDWRMCKRGADVFCCHCDWKLQLTDF